MRQRKARDLDKKLEAFGDILVTEPSPEAWDGAFAGCGGDIYLEIGCGKGKFIVKKAADNPDDRFIAVEGQGTVMLRALTRAIEENGGEAPVNLRFALTFVNGMEKLFSEESLAGVYLNFSDPWPKARHAKRRLTHRDRLKDYARSIRDGGFIEIKTDNDDLFAFTMDEIREGCAGVLEIIELTDDLHNSDYESRLTMTEYEEKFSGRGKNIHYVKVKVNRNKGE
ncbi:MAG: tRNA (guanosine(46)-N7)-methyltransferase TrmB [Clostridiales bacterium]|nr:tRNA (guanosine(46)-N7)-methyltransferase TrmB [Clostridiales bacterium]MDD7035283.1 tRNA (guanosine(46)-N7)-methyltransferase TrmB [Bacillota bacterium]MDY2920611.1 tRNA (guanosine(46)-N7)-methyltransferase TrmB [Lentihominibacter sp.]